MTPDDPFNADECKAQRRAGGGPLTAPICDHMPEQRRQFFASLRYLAMATTDTVGCRLRRAPLGSDGGTGLALPRRSAIPLVGTGVLSVPGQEWLAMTGMRRCAVCLKASWSQ